METIKTETITESNHKLHLPLSLHFCLISVGVYALTQAAFIVNLMLGGYD